MQIRNTFTARNFTVLFLAFFISAVTAQGQSPTPTPDSETIRVNTDLIQTNVTVLDKSNRFVDGLKAEQFELRVDGKPMPISFFERVASSQTKENQQNPTNTKNPIVTNASPTLRERKIIFFVDDLHLSLDSLGRVRDTVSHFIEDEMMPHDKVLIVSARGQIGFLQQFTDNKAVLRAALDRIKPSPNTVRDTEQPPMPESIALRIVNGDLEAAQYYVEKIFEGFSVKNIASMNQRGALEMVRNRANNIASGLVSVSEASLGSLENLMEAINQIGGRKLIFFASDGFYLGSKNTGMIDNTRLQRVINLATRSGSTVYTIDARGLFSFSPDATGERPGDQSGRLERGRIAEEQLSQDALFTLAEHTGGEFLKNQNYFEKWVDRTLEKNSNYYVLSWSPDKEMPSDKNFRQIEISVVGRTDLTVRLPRGYLTSLEKTEAKNKESKKEKTNQKNVKTVTPSVVQETNVKKLLPIILSLNYLDVPNIGAVLTSSVQVETNSLNYGGGLQSAAVDMAGVVFNDQGKQVADFKTGLSVSPLQSDKEQSVIYNNRTPLAPGLYQVKVGARESKSGQTGTATQWIEIPDLAKKQLTLGSLLLGVKTVQKSNKPEDVQTQFSVDHNFARPLQLDFISFIYNAAKASNGEMNLATKIEVFDAQGRAVVNTPMRSLSTKGIADLSRIPLTGAIKQQSSAPGDYLLRVTVNDLIAKTTVVQQTLFTIE